MSRRRNVRVGDSERERAMALLGEHMSAGRLEIDEYDQRCQQAAVARYRSDLDALFTDLPAPRPHDELPAPGRKLPSPRAANVVFVLCLSSLLVFLAVVTRSPLFVLLFVLAAVVLFGRVRR
ncbi:DUF1707 domain-containing protein [Saccharopolyspora taberi]|uniref:DUF1707 SHOCT-like domain-containing protein n=1 Tax=Saccharopolyspora taberi TaxID=60895 RepID=UPI0031DE85DE